MKNWTKEHDFSKSLLHTGCVWEARFKSAVRKGAARESTRGGRESQLWGKVLGKVPNTLICLLCCPTYFNTNHCIMYEESEGLALVLMLNSSGLVVIGAW